MNTLKGYRIFSALIYLNLMVVLTIGNAKAKPIMQAETDFTAIDTYVTEQMNNLSIPGMALGIVQNGQIAHVQGFGVSDSSGRAVTSQTPFYLGSVTKSFTALGVMQLVEAGKIDLDAPVQKYLPWFEFADKEASAKITVRNLLNQTSGISTKDGNRVWSSQQELEEYVRGLNAIQLTQPVGSTFQYSNLNFAIAGLIVEQVSGQSYADYVTQHIFEPLDMRHSFTARAPAHANGLAVGHYYMFGRVFVSEGVVPPANLPAGHLIASVEDLTHYAIAQLNDGRYGNTTILSAQGIAELHMPAISTGGDQHYAMGWNVNTVDGIPLVFHPGDAGRNHAIVLLMPDHNMGFILLANASGFEQADQVDQIALSLFFMLNGKPPTPVSLPFMMSFLHWSILLTPLLQILGILFVWRKRQDIKGWGIFFIVFLNLVVVFSLLGFSQLIPFPLPSLVVFFPDIGYGLIAIAMLGIGWSVIYTAMNLMIRRSK